MAGGGDSGRGGAPPGREELARLGADPGLCSTCRHAAVVASRSSGFLRCGRSDFDPAFPRYPRLPVLACRGYEEVGDGGELA